MKNLSLPLPLLFVGALAACAGTHAELSGRTVLNAPGVPPVELDIDVKVGESPETTLNVDPSLAGLCLTQQHLGAEGETTGTSSTTLGTGGSVVTQTPPGTVASVSTVGTWESSDASSRSGPKPRPTKIHHVTRELYTLQLQTLVPQPGENKVCLLQVRARDIGAAHQVGLDVYRNALVGDPLPAQVVQAYMTTYERLPGGDVEARIGAMSRAGGLATVVGGSQALEAFHASVNGIEPYVELATLETPPVVTGDWTYVVFTIDAQDLELGEQTGATYANELSWRFQTGEMLGAAEGTSTFNYTLAP